MRDALDNPFSPGADTVPPVWAGRTDQLSDWRDIVRPRRLSGLPERGRTILGEPGLGKSSLVRRLAQESRRSGDWVTPQLRIPSGADPLKLIAEAALVLADQAGLASSREKQIGDGPEPFAALTRLLVDVGTAAITRGRVMVLIHIDEVQNITDEQALSQLLIALGDALTYEVDVSVPGGAKVSRSLPIAVYLTGLPDFEDMAGARKGATFARRFKTTTLTALDDDDLAEALQEFVIDGWEVADDTGGATRIRMEPAAASLIIDLCRGEPFLFQLAGEQAWYAGKADTITEEDVRRGWRGAQREAAAHVERILERLPPRERQFLQAMAELAPEERTLTTIAERIGLTKATDAGPTSQRLDTVRGIVERGRPYTFRHRAVEAYLTSEWPGI